MNDYLEVDQERRSLQRSPSQGSQGSGRAYHDDDKQDAYNRNLMISSQATAKKEQLIEPIKRISVDEYFSQFDERGKLPPAIAVQNLDGSNPERTSSPAEESSDESEVDVFADDEDEATVKQPPQARQGIRPMLSFVPEDSNESDSWKAVSYRNNDSNESVKEERPEIDEDIDARENRGAELQRQQSHKEMRARLREAKKSSMVVPQQRQPPRRAESGGRVQMQRLQYQHEIENINRERAAAAENPQVAENAQIQEELDDIEDSVSGESEGSVSSGEDFSDSFCDTESDNLSLRTLSATTIKCSKNVSRSLFQRAKPVGQAVIFDAEANF